MLEFDFQTLPLWANIVTLAFVIPAIAWSADALVDGAAAIARRSGVSELVVGLTIVSIGTSAPEMAVSIGSALTGHGNVALGNVVGSNVFNVGLILGGCAMVRAIPCSRLLLLRDILLLLVGATSLLVMVAGDLSISRIEGIFLLGILGGFFVLVFGQRKHEAPEPGEDNEELMSTGVAVAKTLLGLILILGLSHLLVNSATAVAKSFGISEWIIGVTVVAAGTSTPELATSLMGVLRGRYGIAAGNIIGSDLMNLLGVIGVAAIIQPFAVEPIATYSLMGVVGTILLLGLLVRLGPWQLKKSHGLILVIVGLTRWIADIWLAA